jgi:hypothetical protein
VEGAVRSPVKGWAQFRAGEAAERQGRGRGEGEEEEEEEVVDWGTTHVWGQRSVIGVRAQALERRADVRPAVAVCGPLMR